MEPHDKPHHTSGSASTKKVVQPLSQDHTNDGPNHAADLIRQKISSLYTEEPDAKQEQIEAEAAKSHRSKHQDFMHKLSTSGKSLAEIQTEWHNYYVGLPDKEKHQVWQEFYAANERTNPPEHHKTTQHIQPPTLPHKPSYKPERTGSDSRSVSDIKKQLLGKVQSRPTTKRGGHFKSMLFGLSFGGIVVLIMLFGFFNERIVAPFITPSKSVSNTPIIIDQNTTAAGPEPKIIIPKINVEIPVVFTEPSIAESAVQRALENGVLHYATTPNPGEQGNGVIFGHSSNNILNKGKYKFAFVLLNRLENGDLFMVQKDGKRYVYKVFDKKVVKPTELSVLGSAGKPATFSLITCDPPGTAINRLVVVGEQITPDPAANVASTAAQDPTASTPAELPSNAPSLWQRITNWITG